MAPMQLPRTLDCRIKRVIGLVGTDGPISLSGGGGACAVPTAFYPDSRPEQLRTPRSCRGKKGLSTAFCAGPSKEVGREGGPRQRLRKISHSGHATPVDSGGSTVSEEGGHHGGRVGPSVAHARLAAALSLSSHPKKVSFCALLPSLLLFTRL